MKILKKAGYIILLLLFLLLVLGPFLWAFLLSITPEHAMLAKTLSFLPETVTFENYVKIFGGSRQGDLIFMGITNSLKAVGVTLLIGIPTAMLTAYVLSFMEFKGRKLIKNLLLITMVIPVMATVIPLFRMFVAGGFLDNIFWLSVVYVSSYLPMVTWLVSNYFATVPKELLEAAMIDGCGQVGTFFKILVPSSYPIMLSAALIMFLNTWNQFQIPLILASSLETKPIAIVVSEFMTKDSIQYGITAAAGILAVIPPAVTALIFRRFLISGMMRGSVKG